MYMFHQKILLLAASAMMSQHQLTSAETQCQTQMLSIKSAARVGAM